MYSRECLHGSDPGRAETDTEVLGGCNLPVAHARGIYVLVQASAGAPVGCVPTSVTRRSRFKQECSRPVHVSVLLRANEEVATLRHPM